ncbi:MAG: IPT/TIG domain-containing protein [Bacteroidia bacterium]|nr:IPT/TIG domain-containing protein [Bacteroidia bacterium]
MKKLFTILFSLAITQVFAVTITNLTPTSGPIGTSVTISGTGFSATAANNTVWFGGVKAIIDSASTTSLKVTVPIGAMHAPIRVLVNGSGIAESTKAFVVTYSFGSINTISMETKVDFATRTNPYSVSIGDIDGDGKLDLVVANYDSNSVSVYRNTSTSGTISSGSFATK